MISAAVRRWLAAGPLRRLRSTWCPGHSGVEQNESVDALAKSACIPHTEHWSRRDVSLGFPREAIEDMMRSWREFATAPHPRGRNLLRFQGDRSFYDPTSLNGVDPPIQVAGKDNIRCARTARGIFNHIPTGGFRARFFSLANPPPIALKTCGGGALINFEPSSTHSAFLPDSVSLLSCSHGLFRIIFH
ncbi:hypothetical protein BD779DRAFT_1536727 [Infundibulicybe gibba]|nr:hypothetical protein BD779DRAFT_1536727 [Infundibulicybe gibba]